MPEALYKEIAIGLNLCMAVIYFFLLEPSYKSFFGSMLNITGNQ